MPLLSKLVFLPSVIITMTPIALLAAVRGLVQSAPPGGAEIVGGGVAVAVALWVAKYFAERLKESQAQVQEAHAEQVKALRDEIKELRAEKRELTQRLLDGDE